jgi:hypothetical protein
MTSTETLVLQPPRLSYSSNGSGVFLAIFPVSPSLSPLTLHFSSEEYSYYELIFKLIDFANDGYLTPSNVHFLALLGRTGLSWQEEIWPTIVFVITELTSVFSFVANTGSAAPTDIAMVIYWEQWLILCKLLAIYRTLKTSSSFAGSIHSSNGTSNSAKSPSSKSSKGNSNTSSSISSTNSTTVSQDANTTYLAMQRKLIACLSEIESTEATLRFQIHRLTAAPAATAAASGTFIQRFHPAIVGWKTYHDDSYKTQHVKYRIVTEIETFVPEQESSFYNGQDKSYSNSSDNRSTINHNGNYSNGSDNNNHSSANGTGGAKLKKSKYKSSSTVASATSQATVHDGEISTIPLSTASTTNQLLQTQLLELSGSFGQKKSVQYVQVERRYSEFVLLVSLLQDAFPGWMIPPLPKKDSDLSSSLRQLSLPFAWLQSWMGAYGATNHHYSNNYSEQNSADTHQGPISNATSNRHTQGLEDDDDILVCDVQETSKGASSNNDLITDYVHAVASPPRHSSANNIDPINKQYNPSASTSGANSNGINSSNTSSANAVATRRQIELHLFLTALLTQHPQLSQTIAVRVFLTASPAVLQAFFAWTAHHPPNNLLQGNNVKASKTQMALSSHSTFIIQNPKSWASSIWGVLGNGSTSTTVGVVPAASTAAITSSSPPTTSESNWTQFMPFVSSLRNYTTASFENYSFDNKEYHSTNETPFVGFANRKEWEKQQWQHFEQIARLGKHLEAMLHCESLIKDDLLKIAETFKQMSELASSPPQLAKICLLFYNSIDSYSSSGWAATASPFPSITLPSNHTAAGEPVHVNGGSGSAYQESAVALSQEMYFSVTIPLVYSGYYTEVFRTSLQQRQVQEEHCRQAAREVEAALKEYEMLRHRLEDSKSAEDVFDTEPHHNDNMEALAAAVESSRRLWMEKVKRLDKRDKQLQQVTRTLQTDVPRVRQQQRHNVLVHISS